MFETSDVLHSFNKTNSFSNRCPLLANSGLKINAIHISIVALALSMSHLGVSGPFKGKLILIWGSNSIMVSTIILREV